MRKGQSCNDNDVVMIDLKPISFTSSQYNLTLDQYSVINNTVSSPLSIGECRYDMFWWLGM